MSANQCHLSEPPEGLMAPKQAAGFLQVKLPTLAEWRCKRIGPPWFRVGRLVRYDLSDLRAWLKANRQDVA